MEWQCGNDDCKAWTSQAYDECSNCKAPKSKPLEGNIVEIVEVKKDEKKEKRKLEKDRGNHLYPREDHDFHAQWSTCTLDEGRHTTDDIRTARLKPEKLVERFESEPFEVYLELRKRALEDPNFEFHELADLFLNMHRLTWTLRQRACCGERMKDKLLDSWTQESLRKEILGEVPVKLCKDIEDLAKKKFPYQDSVRFCLKFTKVMEYIVYRARTEWELKGYGVAPSDKDIVDKDVTNAFGAKMKMPRYTNDALAKAVAGAIDKRKKNKGTRFERRRIEKFTAGFSCFPPKVTLADVYALASDFQDWPHDTEHVGRGKTLPKILAERDLIVVPTFNYLSAAFFSRVRGVPMCVIGMIDTEFIPADGICMSPLMFFDHDMYHVLGYPGNSSGAQLWHTIQYRLEELKRKDIDVSKVLEIWDGNTAAIEKQIGLVEDEGERHVLNILAFALLHEPLGISSRTQENVLNGPALAEPHSMIARLNSKKLGIKLLERALIGDFGLSDPTRMKYFLTDARSHLLQIVEKLEADPGKGKFRYAVNTGGDLSPLP